MILFDLLSSLSNDSDLTYGIFCSLIDDKANNDEEIMGIDGVFEWVVENPADVRPYAGCL